MHACDQMVVLPVRASHRGWSGQVESIPVCVQMAREGPNRSGGGIGARGSRSAFFLDGGYGRVIRGVFLLFATLVHVRSFVATMVDVPTLPSLFACTSASLQR